MIATALMPKDAPALSDHEFTRFQRLIHAEAGIFLADGKRALLVARLSRRVRELSLESFGEYCDLAQQDQDERVRLLDLISTNETHFFREPKQFDLLADLCHTWLADAEARRRPRHLRVWSAACSSGEEPYSIGMVLHDHLAAHGWKIEILASDISTRVLERARTGIWSLEKTRDIPPDYLRAYMQKGIGPELGKARVGEAIRSLVRFERINLIRPVYPVTAAFDAVFCRNVLIYFDAHARAQVVERLIDHTAPGGHLFLGHAESLMGRSERVRSVMPAVYRRGTQAADAA